MITSTSPQNPSDVVASVPEVTPEEMVNIIARSRVAQKEWGANAMARSNALRESANALRAHSQELTDLIVREVGKPVVEARGEVGRAIAILDYYAQAAIDPNGETIPPTTPGFLITQRVPHGVAGLITPWNFPIAIPLWKAAPALAAGNSVVLKPSTEALGVALRVAELFEKTLPKDLFLITPGHRGTANALITQADVISFTGSVAVGQSVVATAAGAGKPVQAEMGGQNPAIVLPDADLALTATHLSQASMGFAGQKCTATSRFIVVGDEKRFMEVSDALVAAVEAMAPADPAQEGVLVGPLITEVARTEFTDAAAAAAARGGRILTGGANFGDNGWFAKPAIVTGLKIDDELMQEEVFAPFASITRVKSVDDAITMANGVRYGLTASIHGRDIEAIIRAATSLRTGMVKVNSPTAGVDFHAPFGGTKDSSYGQREQGKDAMRFYSVTRTITLGSGTKAID